MKRTNVTYKIISILAVCTLGFISIVGAYGNTPPPHCFSRKMRSGFRQGLPPAPLFIKILQKEPVQNALTLSETQRMQLESQFEEIQATTAGFRSFIQAEQTGKSKKTGQCISSMQTRRHAVKQGLREVYDRYMSAILRILTPEQVEKLLKRKAVARMLGQLGSELRKLLPAPKNPNFIKLQLAFIERPEEHIAFLTELLFEIYAQEHGISPPRQRLQELQILQI
jgi:hypothetical protein